ncbi:MAG: hypothetical protein JWN17_819 [Frankiales bacterium]|nr:hypothetical protein [Frankiales bacterium]
MPSLPRVLLLAVGGTVVAAGAVLGVATVASAGEVPRGVTLDGVDLGGLGRAAAAAKVRAAVADRTASLPVKADDVTRQLDPAAAGLSLDVDAAVDDAFGGGPLDRVKGLLGTGREVDVHGTVDDAALRRALGDVKAAVDRSPREGTVRFDGTTPVAVAPQSGRTLDLDGAVSAVSQHWLRAAGPVELPVTRKAVTTTPASVQAALTGVAQPAVSAPVTVQVGGKALVVRAADVAAALRFSPDADGALVPALSAPALVAALGDRVAAVEQEPVDARIHLVGGTPQVVPSKPGQTLDAAALVAAVQPALTRPAPRTATVALVASQPSLTTEGARSLGVKEVIGTFTTRHPCCAPRVTNIHRIAALVDDTLVLPGETFSLNGAVGRRTADKGFVEAPQILGGEFVKDVGGGVSQFATTMFNAVFFSGLQDVEHKPHSYYISRYPEGREATVFYPSVDLKWKNDSGHGVLVTTSTTGTSVTVTFYGTKRYTVEALTGPRTNITPFQKEYVTRDDCTPASGANGFDVVVTRVFRQGGREVRRQSFRTRYKPEPNFICGPPPGGAKAGASAGASSGAKAR